MSLDSIHARAARPVAVGVLMAVVAAIVAAVVVVGGLPDGLGPRSVTIGGLGVAALGAGGLIAVRAGLGAQAVMSVVVLTGAATASGGLEGPSIARSLTLLAAGLAFGGAVVATLLQADEPAAKPRDRF